MSRLRTLRVPGRGICLSLVALLLPLLCSVGVSSRSAAATLPNSLTVTNLDVTGDGTNDVIVLYKRSIRAANFRVWTWTTNGGYVLVTNVPPVNTYRGYVQSDPSLRVNAFVNYLGKISLNVNAGANNTVAQVESVDVNLSGPPGTPNPGTGNVEIALTTNRVSPTAQGFLVPRTNMRKMRVGLDTTAHYCANARFLGTNGTIDIGLAVAAAEQRLNDTDYFYARDMGLAWEVTEFILRLDGDPINWKSFWAGGDGITPLPFNDKIRLDGDTGGGSAGTIFSATEDFPNSHSVTTGGPNNWQSASIGHESGHGLNLGHYSSHDDTMSGSESALGAGTVQRAIEQLHLASAVSAPAITYGDALAPYAMEDFATTTPGQPVDINVLANDYDGNGDVIHLSYVDAVTEAGGTVTNLGGGVVRYTPPAVRLGVDRFRYHVADSGGIENRTGVVKVYVRNSGLASHWLFDETNRAVVHDVGPYQAHGTVESDLTTLTAGSQAGVIGRAYENLVQDTKSSVSFDTGDPLDRELSVSLWVKFNSLTNKDRCIISKGGAVISGRIDNIRGGWAISVVGGKFYFASKLEPDLEFTNPAADLQGGSAVVTNQWYHLAMVMDRTNHVLKAWINNASVNTSPGGNTYIPDGFIENFNPLHILNCGHDDASTAAVVDDVRIYNLVLSTADVAALFAANDEIPAGAPAPSDGATGASALSVLNWMPGKPAGYLFDVYLGTNQSAVAGATTNSPLFRGRFSTNAYTPGLAVSTAYFWRVDEILTNGAVVPGGVWTFTTKSTIEYEFDNGGGDGIWTNALNWNPDGVPVATNDYIVTGSYTALSPGALEDITPATYTFGGKSLTVSGGATLNLKKLNSGGTDVVMVNITNLTVDNSTLMTECARNLDLSLNTSVRLIGDNTLSLGGGAFQRWFRFKGGMTGSGTVHLSRDTTGASRQMFLAAGNFGGYSGNWLVEAASAAGELIELFCQTTNGWGSGDMTLGAWGDLTISSNVTALDSTLSLAVNATAHLNANLRTGGFSGTGGVISNASGANLSVGKSDESATFAGVIAGAGSFTKEGVGTLTLTGTNTYTGTTTVTNDGTSQLEEALGTLLVNGAIGNGAVTVNAACALGGTGTIGGVVTVKPGAYLAPGSSVIGTLTLSNAPVLQGTTLMKLNRSASPNADRLLRSGGGLTFGGTLTVTNVGGTLLAGDTFALFTATNYSGSFSATNLPPLGAGLKWDTSRLVVDGTLSVVQITLTLTYTAGANGTISGISPQIVNFGGSGSTVTAVPATNYQFANWSDGSAANPRTDTNVTNHLSVTANFMSLLPAVVTNLGFAAGGTLFTVSGTGAVNQVYVLVATTNFPATWVPLQTNPASTNGVFGFTDPQATNYSRRFYRVLAQ